MPAGEAEPHDTAPRCPPLGVAPSVGDVIEFATSTAHAYVRSPLEQLLVVAERLGDELANERPPGPHTNSVAAIIVHCCAVAEFWLGHVALGRPTTRDRDAEFAGHAELTADVLLA